jgi:uncharacterized protein YjiK
LAGPTADPASAGIVLRQRNAHIIGHATFARDARMSAFRSAPSLLMKIKSLLTSLAAALLLQAAYALNPGDIAFTGFNSDGSDALAFVALAPIPAGTEIFFTDDEWNGLSIGSGGNFIDEESEFKWTAPAGGVAAGTIVSFSNVSNTPAISASSGTVVFTDTTNTGVSNSSDTVYAFQGATDAPTGFIAAISNGSSTEVAAQLLNTGLTAGSTAVALPSSTDGGRYTGSRSDQATFAGYGSLIGNVATNWEVTTGDGTTFLPFSSTAFTTTAVTATLAINSVSLAEGNSGSTTLTLTVTRSDTATAFTVNYAVTGGTATSGIDYATLASGTLNFTNGGAATQPINISVTGDTTPELDETVIITLSNVVNATGTTTISTAVGTGTIVNDDVIAPQITTQPASTTIVSGGVTTLTVAASGSPTPTYQWYEGSSGVTTNPVSGATSASFTTPTLTATTSYWARATNTGGTADSNTATVTVTTGVTSVNLDNYVRVGRYSLPVKPVVSLPPGTPSHNVLCEEASAVTYNWDTDTLFIACDGGRSITQVSKTGQLIDTMTLALGSSPQGTDFYDPEGITYIGGGQFVITEERDRQLVKFTYVAGTTLSRSGAQTVDLGSFVDNTGTEGLSYDPQTNSAPNLGFICLNEISPRGIFQTGVDFAAGTATNGPPASESSGNLFNPSLLGMTDVADVFAFSNIPSMVGGPQAGNLLVLGQEDARVVNVSRTGVIHSTLQIVTDPGNPLTPGAQQHEGITMDRSGIIYVVNENGGGGIEFPQLWVYAPATAANQAPTAVALNNTLSSIIENTNTASPIKLGDIVVTDDGLGTNTFSLTGANAASFEITGTALYLKAGVVLDFETQTSYAVTVNVDDTTLGSTPDATVNFTLTVTDQQPETAPTPVIIISEVCPWSSTVANSPIGADWFELTNTSTSPVTITGWKVDDDSAAFGTALTLNGITTIAPGESVVFIETSDLAGKSAEFKTLWFGGSPPAGLQIGNYSGGGIGLSTGGDQVNIFNATGVLQAKVTFGTADSTVPRQTFDNTVGLNNATISLLSAAGVNGAFVAVNDANEVGSPGYSAPGDLRITEVAPWSSGNSPVAVDWFEITNIGARAVDITGWKVDDNTESATTAGPLAGVTSIAPGESVVFVDTTNLPATAAAFRTLWFGDNPPANLQIGGYSGAGGLGTGGDAVNLYDTTNPTPARRAKVFFGGSTLSAPFKTFDNAAALENQLISQYSAIGYNGAFAAVNDVNEIGSPGVSLIFTPATGSFAAWLAANSYTSGGIDGDTDFDNLDDIGEYFFNQNPNRGQFTGTMPHLVMNGSDLEFRFSFLTGIADASGSLLTSGDLFNWSPALEGTDYEVISSTPNGSLTDVRFRLFSSPAQAPRGPFTYLTPNTTHVKGGALNGITITNHGLVGSGRLSGALTDAFGETMGAASGLSITGWSYNAALSRFEGTFNVLPDRGYNFGAIFSNYAARIHTTPFTFVPYFGAGPVTPNQITPTYASSTKFVYDDGFITKFTTGLNPTGVSTILGQQVGTVTAANGVGGAQVPLISFDAEALHVFPDGSGFVSDEYGTYIGRFDATKKITKLLQLPAAAQPHRPFGTLNFDSVTTPTNGRRNNQGLEGLSVSPDNTRLFALMQSALVQDSGAAQTRINTRLYVYDIAGANLENPVLIGEYLVQLPKYRLNGNGSAADATAAQSEIVAISNSQFLMLPRDGNGLGKGASDPVVTKTVDLVDFTTATNVLGLYDAEGNQTSPGGNLLSSITPASSIVVVNLISATDLAKFGLNTNVGAAANQFSINEKMEGMALVPDLSTASPDDFYLFVANDNDFQSPDVQMLNAAGNIVSYGDGRLNAGITNDAVFYAYRLTITSNVRKFYRMEVTED